MDDIDEILSNELLSDELLSDELVNGRTDFPLIVEGGKPRPFSNRMIEKAPQLPTVETDLVNTIRDDINTCESLNALEIILDNMADNDIHFVGTRNHVYNSKQMLRVLAVCREEFYFDSWLPRTLGFRAKALQLLEEQTSKEDNNE